MLPVIHTVFTYAACLAAVPMLVSCDFVRSTVLPRVSHALSLDLISADTIVLHVALITVFTHVLMGFAVDLAHNCRGKFASCHADIKTAGNEVHQRFSGGAECPLAKRLEHAHRQLNQFFPPFVVSSFLIWGNTNKFNTFRESFVVLQSILLILLPAALCCPERACGSIVKIAYRSVLFWTVLYSVMPRETTSIIGEVTRLCHTFDTISEDWK